MSLSNENGSNGLSQPERPSTPRLRQPMAKNFSSENNTYRNNGSKDVWPIKNNQTNPGEPIWNNSLFDFSQLALPAPSNLDKGWQSLKGFDSGPWPQTSQQQQQQKPKNGHLAPPGFEVGGNNIGNTKTCSSCDETAKAAGRCNDCQEDLCDVCVSAHQRVKLTKDHLITWLDKAAKPPLSNAVNATVSSPLPVVNNTEVVTSVQSTSPFEVNNVNGGLLMNGNVVQHEVLQVYQGAVEKAKTECKTLISKANLGVTQIEEAKGSVREMKARVDLQYNTVKQDITNTIRQYVGALQDREGQLLKRLETIRSVKQATLDKQKTDLNTAQGTLSNMTEQLALCSRSGHEMELIKTTNAALESLKEVKQICGDLQPHEDDKVAFARPDPVTLNALRSLSFVGGSGYAPFSQAEGGGLKRAILGKDARFIVVVKDQLQEQRTVGGDPLRINVAGPDGRIVRHSVFDAQNGTYKVIWKPTIEGEHTIGVTLKDLHIQGSPFNVKVRVGRNYSQVQEPLRVFGTEGESEGQLCRPWGVCCSKNGLILVANRSNNRIEVYDLEGRFLYHFGTGGKGQGEFERPASAACDSMNRVIVTDKDNHRIQIFTIKGEFLQMFGEKGSKLGQFNYPWDVAVNSRDCILVSDTRNHRIQLFSPHGEYLSKYGFEGRDWKYFDSPRGVCFTPDDQIVVTDFNNHRLLVVKSDFSCAQYLGKEGTDDGMFTRPNGVSVDEEGNIIVADSRNDRVQVFTSSGVFITKFGLKGTNPGEFDRPSGICISPDGAIIVVDFGNNRVQIF